MATSIINKVIHDFKLVYTTATPSGTIAAHGGAGANLTPTAPSGYTFLTHLGVWNTGVVGVTVAFDTNQIPAESINVYQNNTTSGTTNRGKINLLSLYYK